jgi:L-iditol 2-dehydrogenase
LSLALTVLEPGEVILEDRPEPSAGEDEILIRPVMTGICGTDLEIIDGRIDLEYVNYPIVLGHEWTGSVTFDPLGAMEPGDAVVVEGIVPCGRCKMCLARKTNLCVDYDEIGFTRDGAAAEAIVVPRGLIHRLDDSVSSEDAAMVEPCAVVHRALLRAGPEHGSRCLIVGDGTIALLAAHLLRMFDPNEIVVLGKRPDQESLVLGMGADRFEIDPAEAEEDFDLVIEAAGATAAAETAFAAAGRGATVVLLGLPPHGDKAAVGIDDLVNADLTVFGSFGYTSSAWTEVVKLMNDGRIHPSGAVTHRFGLEEWEDALATLRHSDGPRGKVMFEIGEAG